MSKIEKDLGASSAYAYAVQYGGYTGTEEEYGQEMADLANISAEAETLAPDEEASASYSGGVLSFGVPQGVTGNGIASAVLNSDFTLTLTFTDGTIYTTPTPIRGEPGAKGDPGAKGEPGATGNGITSIAKTGTSGLVDTYTITFTDETTTTFTVTNGTAAIDDTLSIAGKAADAKATGDAVNDLKSAIISGGNETASLVSGARNYRGDILQNSARCTTAKVYSMSIGETIKVINVDSGLKFAVAGVKNRTFVFDSGWQTSEYIYKIAIDAEMWFVNISKISNEDLSPSEVATLRVIFEKETYFGVLDKKIELNSDGINNSIYSTFVNLEIGYWAVSDGLPVTANNWARSTGYIPKSAEIYVNRPFALLLMAYDHDDNYVGTWDATNKNFTKVYSDLLLLRGINFAEISAYYPSYRFKLSITSTSGTIDIDVLRNGAMSVNDTLLINANKIDGVPAYYLSHMKTKNASIRDNIKSVGKNGETFVFITDIHWENNYRNSPTLVQNVFDKTNVRILICGGDLINTAVKSTAENLIQSCVKAFDFPTHPMHTAFGNHDANSLNWQTDEQKTANMFDASEVFGLTQKNSSYANNYITGDGINFYFDRTDSRTRFIFLDTGTDSTYPSGTIPALCNTLNETPNGYKVVIVQHWYFNGVTVETATLTTTARSLMAIVKQYNERGSYTYNSETYSFANASGEIILLLGGHTHYDIVLNVDDADNIAGVPIVCTADDSTRDRTATEGTITEQCFDVITLDYVNRIIKCVRIGDGTDRTISF